MNTILICLIIILFCLVVLTAGYFRKMINIQAVLGFSIIIIVCLVVIFNTKKSIVYRQPFENSYGEYQRLFNSACASPMGNAIAGGTKALALELDEGNAVKQVDAFMMHNFISPQRTPKAPAEVEALIFSRKGKTTKKIGEYTDGTNCYMAYVDLYGVDVRTGTCSSARLEGTFDDCPPVTSTDEKYADPNSALYRQFLGE
jgi:hypothetical protein